MPLTQSLPVQLTPEELAAAGQELAAALGEIESEETDKAEYASERNAAIKRLEARAHVLALKIRTKTENRDVEVREVVDVELGEYRTERLDTGEIVDRREMTEQQKHAHAQGDLPLEPAAEAPARGPDFDGCADCGKTDLAPEDDFIFDGIELCGACYRKREAAVEAAAATEPS